MRFAHISDLHFGSVTLSPFQFFSKRWAGNFNYLFLRKKHFCYDRLLELIDLFKEKGITHVFVTGDLTVTSRRKEFKQARRFFQMLKEEGISVFTIPGNHDHYTKTAYRKKKFYRFFDPLFDKECPFNLKDHKVSYTKVKEGLWVVGLDTAVATSLTSSEGYFSPETEENLEKVLQEIPKDDWVILLNHFPFFQNDPEKKQLIRAPLLKKLIAKFPNILLYLHGHTHRQIVADLRPNDLPIISDSGSTSFEKDGACHLFAFDDNAIQLDVFRYDGEWKESEKHKFTI